jgi:hypothetical protein
VVSLVLGSPVPEAEAEADPSPAAYASDYAYYLPAALPSPPSSQYHAQVKYGKGLFPKYEGYIFLPHKHIFRHCYTGTIEIQQPKHHISNVNDFLI